MANIQQVKRETLTGTVKAFTFDKNCGRYAVKNFSNGDIYVSFEETVETATSIKIAKGMGQICQINEHYGADGQDKSKTIYVKGTGEVEVQQLWY